MTLSIGGRTHARAQMPWECGQLGRSVCMLMLENEPVEPLQARELQRQQPTTLRHRRCRDLLYAVTTGMQCSYCLCLCPRHMWVYILLLLLLLLLLLYVVPNDPFHSE